MQADVQRNVNQETRVEQGVKSGALTKREMAKLERGRARVGRKEASAAQNGHVTKDEQAGIQNADNKQSEEIFDKKQSCSRKKKEG